MEIDKEVGCASPVGGLLLSCGCQHSRDRQKIGEHHLDGVVDVKKMKWRLFVNNGLTSETGFYVACYERCDTICGPRQQALAAQQDNQALGPWASVFPIALLFVTCNLGSFYVFVLMHCIHPKYYGDSMYVLSISLVEIPVPVEETSSL